MDILPDIHSAFTTILNTKYMLNKVNKRSCVSNLSAFYL